MKKAKCGTKRIRGLGTAIETDSEMDQKTIIKRLNNETANFLRRAMRERNFSDTVGLHPNQFDVMAEEYRKTATALNLAARELERLWREE